MVPSLKKGVLILKKGSHPVMYEDCESDGPQVIKRKLFYVCFTMTFDLASPQKIGVIYSSCRTIRLYLKVPGAVILVINRK